MLAIKNDRREGGSPYYVTQYGYPWAGKLRKGRGQGSDVIGVDAPTSQLLLQFFQLLPTILSSSLQFLSHRQRNTEKEREALQAC